MNKKNTLGFFLLVVASAVSNAQITVTNAVFPRVGDSYYYDAIDSLTQTVLVTPASTSAQTWNYSTFRNVRSQTEDIFAPSPSDPTFTSRFPTADYITSFAGLEAYVDITSTEVNILGGKGDLGLGTPTVANFSPTRLLRFAPMTMGTTKTNNSQLKTTIPLSSAPQLHDLILTQLQSTPLGAIVRDVDSIRINYQAQVAMNVEAFGSLTIPGLAATNVLRLKKIETPNTKIEVRVVTLAGNSWFDITTLAAGRLPIPTKPIKTYEFWDNQHRQALMTFTTTAANSDTIRSAAWANFTASVNMAKVDETLLVGPSPASTNLTVQLPDAQLLENETIALELYNMNGQKVLSQPFNGNANLNVSNLSMGFYNIALRNQKGTIVTTRKVLVLH